jgi:hypothetical protein
MRRGILVLALLLVSALPARARDIQHADLDMNGYQLEGGITPGANLVLRSTTNGTPGNIISVIGTTAGQGLKLQRASDGLEAGEFTTYLGGSAGPLGLKLDTLLSLPLVSTGTLVNNDGQLEIVSSLDCGTGCAGITVGSAFGTGDATGYQLLIAPPTGQLARPFGVLNVSGGAAFYLDVAGDAFFTGPFTVSGLVGPGFVKASSVGLFSVDSTTYAPTTRTITTNLPLTGGGSLASNLTLGANVFTASGSGHATGIVPDPGSSAGISRFLREDSTFAVPPGTAGAAITALSGDGSATGPGAVTFTLNDIPSGTPALGSILFTNIAAPGTPASGKSSCYVDSTTLIYTCKNASAILANLAVPNAGTTHQFFTAFSSSGVYTLAQPVEADVVNLVSDLAGKQATGNYITALTGDVSATGPGSVAATLNNIPNGTTAAGDILHTSIAAPSTPASGKVAVYTDSTSKNIAAKNDAGTINHGAQTFTAASHQFATALADTGAWTTAQPSYGDISGSVPAITSLTGDVTGSGTGAVATTIANNAVSSAKFRQSGADTLVGNPTGSSANVTDIGLIAPLFFSGGNLVLDYDASSLVLSGGTVLIRAALTGDVTASAGLNTTTLANIPNDVTMAGDLLATGIAAPSSPASGKGRIYFDSTSLNLAVKNASGVVNHGAQSNAGTSHEFFTALSDAGAFTLGQPGFSDLTGAESCGQQVALTGDVTTSGCAATLANTGITAGYWINGNGYFQVDAKGRIIGASGGTNYNASKVNGTSISTSDETINFSGPFVGATSSGTTTVTFAQSSPVTATYHWSGAFESSGFGLVDNLGAFIVPSGDIGIAQTSIGLIPGVSQSLPQSVAAQGSTTVMPLLKEILANYNGATFSCALWDILPSGSGTATLNFQLWYTTNAAITGDYVTLDTISITGPSFTLQNIGRHTITTSIPQGAYLILAISRNDTNGSMALLNINFSCQADLYQ